MSVDAICSTADTMAAPAEPIATRTCASGGSTPQIRARGRDVRRREDASLEPVEHHGAASGLMSRGRSTLPQMSLSKATRFTSDPRLRVCAGSVDTISPRMVAW